MNESAPTKGGWSDAPTERVSSVAGWARPVDSLVGSVRTCPSNADRNQSNATTTGTARSQSEGDLAVREAAERRAERRPSGKSAAKRSEARQTGGGAEAVPSAGWRAVAEALDASGGMRP